MDDDFSGGKDYYYDIQQSYTIRCASLLLLVCKQSVYKSATVLW